MVREYPQLLDNERVRRLLTRSTEVIPVVLRSLFLMCLWLAAACSVEGAPSQAPTAEDRTWLGDANADVDAIPQSLSNRASSYRNEFGASDRIKPVPSASRRTDTSLPEPVTLLLVGVALITASCAARRLQGRGFRVRFESTVMGREWVVAREAEDAAMARWADVWQSSRRTRSTHPMVQEKAPLASRTERVLPQAQNDAAHSASIHH